MDLALLDDILTAFDQATSTWAATLQPIALSLFWSLGTIEWAYTFYRLLVRERTGLGDVLETAVRKFLYLGFLYWLILKSPAIFPMIVASFQRAGGQAAGITALHPSAFLNTGVTVAINILSSMDALGFLVDPFGRSIALIGAIAALGLFALMAASVMLTLIESFLLISGATQILLGFAACRWTASLADHAVSSIFRIGLKLMITYMITAVVASLLYRWSNLLAQSSSIGLLAYLSFLGSLLTACLLLWILPQRLASYLVPPNLHLGLSPAMADN
jgi:P-type conjugative transfer protein TrbL